MGAIEGVRSCELRSFVEGSDLMKTSGRKAWTDKTIFHLEILERELEDLNCLFMNCAGETLPFLLGEVIVLITVRISLTCSPGDCFGVESPQRTE